MPLATIKWKWFVGIGILCTTVLPTKAFLFHKEKESKNIALFSFNLCISTVSVCSISDYYIFLSLPDLNMTVK